MGEKMCEDIDKTGKMGYNIAVYHLLSKGDFIMKVTKDSIIGEVLDFDRETAKFFLEIGMHCLGCPSARGESIEMACEVHGTDADELVEKINAFLESK